jgi:hypothetical protein
VTDPPTTSSAVERREPSQPLAEAVRDLYRACHLPVPSVLVAPSAPEFVRIVLALGQGWWPGRFLVLELVAFNVFALGLGWYAMSLVLEQGLTRSASTALVLAAYLSISFAVLTASPIWMRHPRHCPRPKS